jgi:hypothetical protein
MYSGKTALKRGASEERKSGANIGKTIVALSEESANVIKITTI